MNAQDWENMASVFRAGQKRARGWEYNNDRQQDADILEAQADRCEEIARALNGNPPVEHDHYHFHREGGHRYQHAHPHAHDQGGNEHEGHWHDARLVPANWGSGGELR